MPSTVTPGIPYPSARWATLDPATCRASGTLIRKRVDFYLMTFESGELTPQLSEVDDVEWVLLSDAIPRASFESERKLLEMASQEIELVRASLQASPASSSSSS